MLIVWKSGMDGGEKSPEVREAWAAVPALLLTGRVTVGSDCQAQLSHSKKWEKSGPMISKGPSISSLKKHDSKAYTYCSNITPSLKNGENNPHMFSPGAGFKCAICSVWETEQPSSKYDSIHT